MKNKLTFQQLHNSGLTKNLLSKHIDHGHVQTLLVEAKLLGRDLKEFDMDVLIEKCKDLTDNILDFYLAMDGEVLAGVLTVHVADHREIGMLWVEEGYRKKGVGKGLVELFKKSVVPLPLKVECLKGNLKGLEFYQSLGFEFTDKARFPTNLVGYTKVKL